MSEIEISVAESKKDFTKLIRDSADKNDSFIITKRGKPAAVIVSFEDYQKLRRMAGYAELIKLRSKLSKCGISAQEALQYGLINKVVSQDELMSSAMQMAERLCLNGPVALRLAKEVALKSRGVPREMGYLMEMEIGGQAFATEDAREGPMAFFEKRKPNFRGL